LLASILGLASVTQATGGPVCRPALAVTEVRFSEMLPPTNERKWSAVVTVDASSCAANASGYFEIGFLRQKETGLELDFVEEFIWLPPRVRVGVDFWADEAVEQYWINKVTPCACAK
jgi:hypothetical protein